MARYIDADKLPRNNGVLDTGFTNKMLIKFVFTEDIDKAPTADVVEVRRGEWIEKLFGFCNVCTECDATVERTAIKNNSGKFNFCPNCGADMRGNNNDNRTEN